MPDRSSPYGERERLRAALDALASLASADHFRAAAPSERGVRYAAERRLGIAPLYDVYGPPARPRPESVVLVHGGGFVVGSRAMKPMRWLATRFVEAGVTVCSVDYRLIFRGGGLYEALDDVLAALAHWHASTASRGLDPRRVSLVGLSAGGTLAMLAAARSREPVHRLACVFGLYELDQLTGPISAALPTLLLGTRDRSVWSAHSPRHAAQPAAPTLLLHGGADALVPPEQAERLAAHRRSLGLPTELRIYPGAPHGFFNAPCEAADLATDALIEQIGRAGS